MSEQEEKKDGFEEYLNRMFESDLERMIFAAIRGKTKEEALKALLQEVGSADYDTHN